MNKSCKGWEVHMQELIYCFQAEFALLLQVGFAIILNWESSKSLLTGRNSLRKARQVVCKNTCFSGPPEAAEGGGA
jgi:hypothetical protein